MVGKTGIKKESVEIKSSLFQQIIIERIQVNSGQGFLLTVDGEKTALSEREPLLELIQESVFEGEPYGDVLAWHREQVQLHEHFQSELLNAQSQQKGQKIELWSGRIPCPKCGSKNTRKFGNRFTDDLKEHTRGCNKCGWRFKYNPSGEELKADVQTNMSDKTTEVHQPSHSEVTVHSRQLKFSKEIVTYALNQIGKKTYAEIVIAIQEKFGQKISAGVISIWKKKQLKTKISESEETRDAPEAAPQTESDELKYKQDTNPVVESEPVNELQDLQSVCPICGGENIMKNGKDTDGVKRYWCLVCDTSYREDVGGNAPEGTECPVCKSTDCMCWGIKKIKQGIKPKYFCKECKKKFSGDYTTKFEQKKPEPQVEELVKTEFEPSKQQIQIIMNMAREDISITGRVSAEKVSQKTGLDVFAVAKVLMDNKEELSRAMDNYEDSKFERKINADTKVIGHDYGGVEVGNMV